MFRSFDPDYLTSKPPNIVLGCPPDPVRTTIVTETRSNPESSSGQADAYAQVLTNGTQTSVTNGLNQLSTVNGTAAAYDARGNMTTDPVTGKAYTYQVTDNQLSKVTAPFTTFAYDALGRLSSIGIPGTQY